MPLSGTVSEVRRIEMVINLCVECFVNPNTGSVIHHHHDCTLSVSYLLSKPPPIRLHAYIIYFNEAHSKASHITLTLPILNQPTLNCKLIQHVSSSQIYQGLLLTICRLLLTAIIFKSVTLASGYLHKFKLYE